MCNSNSSLKDQSTLAGIVAPAMDDYIRFLKENNSIDFSDMLTHAEDLVRVGAFSHSLKYLIVDEYQDITAAQYRLLKALRDQTDYELFCVGDDWQSIRVRIQKAPQSCLQCIKNIATAFDHIFRPRTNSQQRGELIKFAFILRSRVIERKRLSDTVSDRLL